MNGQNEVLLSFASDFVQKMFSIPQPSAECKDQEPLPVIPIDADGSPLRSLLSFCNPGETPEIAQLEEVQKLAKKYEVAKRILKERIWNKFHLIPPIMLATIERNTGRDSDNNAHFAAIVTMLFPEEDLEGVVVNDLELVTKAQFDSLLAYQKACVAAAVEVTQPPHGHYTRMSEVWTRSNWFRNDGGEHTGYRC
jgi:hypothetical protein